MRSESTLGYGILVLCMGASPDPGFQFRRLEGEPHKAEAPCGPIVELGQSPGRAPVLCTVHYCSRVV